MSMRRLDGLSSRGAAVLDLSGGRNTAAISIPQTFAHGPLLDGIRRTPQLAAATTVPALETAQYGLDSTALPRRERSWRWAIVGSSLTALGLSGIIAYNLHARLTSAPAAAQVARQTSPVAAAAAPAKPQLGSDLQPLLDAFVAGKAPMGVSIINLKTGQTFGTNPNQVFVSASLYKLYVALAIYKQIDNGSLTLTSTVPNAGVTVDTCLNRMITVSDNTCGEALGSLVGWEQQNAMLHASGFANTGLYASQDERTTAADTALLFKRLYDGSLVSAASSQHFLGLLKAQQINDRLPAGLPSGTTVAHKTGDLNGLLHDAGIVYGPKGDYVISVLSGPWNISGASGVISDLNAKIYAALEK
jgi:beta-lactamase class A